MDRIHINGDQGSIWIEGPLTIEKLMAAGVSEEEAIQQISLYEQYVDLNTAGEAKR